MAAEKDLVIAEGGSKKKFIIIGAAVLLVVLAGVSLGRLYPGEDALANGLVVAVTETVTDEDIEALATALQEGMRTLKMDGMEKVLSGATDMKQVRAVCIK